MLGVRGCLLQMQRVSVLYWMFLLFIGQVPLSRAEAGGGRERGRGLGSPRVIVNRMTSINIDDDFGNPARKITMQRKRTNNRILNICWNTYGVQASVCCQDVYYDFILEGMVFEEGQCDEITELQDRYSGGMGSPLPTAFPFQSVDDDDDNVQCVVTRGPTCLEDEIVHCSTNSSQFNFAEGFNMTIRRNTQAQHYSARLYAYTFGDGAFAICGLVNDPCNTNGEVPGNFKLTCTYRYLTTNDEYELVPDDEDVELYSFSQSTTRIFGGQVHGSNYIFYTTIFNGVMYVKYSSVAWDSGSGAPHAQHVGFIYDFNMGGSGPSYHYLNSLDMADIYEWYEEYFVVCWMEVYPSSPTTKVFCRMGDQQSPGDTLLNLYDGSVYPNTSAYYIGSDGSDLSVAISKRGEVGVLCFSLDVGNVGSKTGRCYTLQISESREYAFINETSMADINDGASIGRLSGVEMLESPSNENYFVVAYEDESGFVEMEVHEIGGVDDSASPTTEALTEPTTTAVDATTALDNSNESCGDDEADCTGGFGDAASVGFCGADGHCVCDMTNGYICAHFSETSLESGAGQQCAYGGCELYEGDVDTSGGSDASAALTRYFSYSISVGAAANTANLRSVAMAIVDAVASYIGKSVDAIDNFDIQLDLESSLANLAKTYVFSFDVTFSSDAEAYVASTTLDLAIVGSSSADQSVPSATNDDGLTIFMSDLTSFMVSNEAWEWVVPLYVVQGTAYLPAENCTLHGANVSAAVQSHNLTSGVYCLISMYGWSYYIRTEEDCHQSYTNASQITIPLSQVASNTVVSSETDDTNATILYAVSAGAGVLLLLAILAVVFYMRKYRRGEKHLSRLQSSHSKLKRVLEAQNVDMRMLISAWQVKTSELELIAKLGMGSFGEVWRGRWLHKIDVAVKFLKGTNDGAQQSSGSSGRSGRSNDGSGTDHFERSEIKFLMRTRDPYIVLFLGCGVSSDDGRPFILSEFCEGGSLDSFLWHASSSSSTKNATVAKKSLTLSERVHVLLDVALGLRYLHVLHKSIHRDIKSPNILMARRPGSAYRKTTWMGKLGDFGLSRLVLKGKRRQRHSPVRSDRQTDKRDRQCLWKKRFGSSQVGTLSWMAPELLAGTHVYGPEIDIYSFGVLMWEAMSESRPWRGVSHDHAKLRRLVREGRRPVCEFQNVDQIPSDLPKLMRDCWHQNPDARPTILEVTKRLYAVIDPEDRRSNSESSALSQSYSSSDESTKMNGGKGDSSLMFKKPKHRLTSRDGNAGIGIDFEATGSSEVELMSLSSGSTEIRASPPSNV